jgi:hypothetical protein
MKAMLDLWMINIGSILALLISATIAMFVLRAGYRGLWVMSLYAAVAIVIGYWAARCDARWFLQHNMFGPEPCGVWPNIILCVVLLKAKTHLLPAVGIALLSHIVMYSFAVIVAGCLGI